MALSAEWFVIDSEDDAEARPLDPVVEPAAPREEAHTAQASSSLASDADRLPMMQSMTDRIIGSASGGGAAFPI
jgi:hypothetical protein